MKKYLIILAGFAIVACKNNTDPEVRTAPSQMETSDSQSIDGNKDLNVTTTQVETSFKTEEAQLVYANYLALKGALVNTDASVAQTAAADFSKQVATVPDTNEKLMQSLEVIAGSAMIKDQRIAFEDVSREVEAMLDSEIKEGTIFKQYCPMAFNGKGAFWLSDSKEVRNPYFGDEMLTCGVVDKEIN